MADWVTISSLATAGGTLVLAAATFASVRSANRSARIAERALQVGLRPLLTPSKLEDPLIKVLWVDGHHARIEGGRAAVEVVDGVIYLAMSLRNVGSGMAVLHGWHPWPERVHGDEPHADPARFRTLTRDLYVPPGDIGFWQGAFRDPEEPGYAELCEAVQSHRPLTVELLYGDHEGGQRMVSRFALTSPSGDGTTWLASVGRHWNLDRPDPR
jgi:hypothetical protein